jgi:hypothetical protein
LTVRSAPPFVKWRVAVAKVFPSGNRFVWSVAYRFVPGSPRASVVGTRMRIAAAMASRGAQ